MNPLIWKESDDLFGHTVSTGKPEPSFIHERKPGKHYKGGEIKKRYFTDAMPGGSGKKRSKTFPGIAKAMADQWG